MADKKITTIKIENEVKDRLEHLKEHEKESYNDAIKKALYIINVFRKSPASAMKILKNIDRTKPSSQAVMLYNRRGNLPNGTYLRFSMLP